MSRVFAIADLHLGHKLVAGLRGFATPDAHDAELVRRWNETVTKRDVVYVLGDVFRTHMLPHMHGIKKLAMGNHDRGPVALYAPLFSKVQACFEFDGCLLSHIPVHPNQFGRYRKNVHGHMHAHRIEDPRYVCVSVEQVDMRPVLLRELTA
jgi:calcineurin-like phosphoesterase family protein